MLKDIFYFDYGEQMKKSFFVIFLIFLCFNSLKGAELTTVLDAFDEDNPFDLDLEIKWGWDSRRATITREYIQKDKIIFAKELSYKRTSNILFIEPSFGVYKDVELFFSFPFVLSDKADLSFSSGVGHNNSIIDPQGGPSLFSVPDKGPTRKGFGDMVLGIKYSPFSQERDPFFPSWVIAMKYKLPTGKVKKANNNGVGLGTHELTLETSISRRMYFFEPFFQFYGTFKFPSDNSLFKNYGITQTGVDPGEEMGLAIGLELYPWESPSTGGGLSFDFGFNASYLFEGRGYSEIFEALGDSPCDPANGCDLTTYTRYEDKNTTPQKGAPLKTDGITDIEAYGKFGTWIGFNFMPVKYVQLKFHFFYTREISHFITFADAGKDLDKDGAIQPVNKQNANEFNPVYNRNYDALGKRLKNEGTDVYGILLSITGKL